MSDISEARVYKTITKRTKDLISGGEGLNVDYKRDVKAIEVGDLVAFANSDAGGYILVGVDEYNDENGFQKGLVVGCTVGDKEKMVIINKAKSTRPPVEVEVVIENTSHQPFYRIEIPSGSYKPYCTEKGEYRIRSDGRNTALLPEKLLSIFLEVQGKKFIERFKKATEKLEEVLDLTQDKLLNIDEEIDSLSGAVNSKIESLLSDIDSMASDIKRYLNSIFESATNADSLADEAMNYSMEAVGEIQDVNERIKLLEELTHDINDRVISIMQNLKIEDPIILRIRNKVKFFTKQLYHINKNKKEVQKAICIGYAQINKDILNQWMEEAFAEYDSSEYE